MTRLWKTIFASIVFMSIISCNETNKTIGKCKVTYSSNTHLGTDSCISSLSKDAFLQRIAERDSMFVVYGCFHNDSLNMFLNKKLVDRRLLNSNMNSCSSLDAGGTEIKINKSKNNRLKIQINDSCSCTHNVPDNYLTCKISYSGDSIFINYTNRFYSYYSLIKRKYVYH